MAKIKKEHIPFTQIANQVLNDKTLSWKAKGLYSYLFSKPEGWQFETIRIAKESTDGRDSTRSALKELEDAGYLERAKMSNHRMEYRLKYSQNNVTENPSLPQNNVTENQTVGKSNSLKSRQLSNKEEESNKEKRVIGITAIAVGNGINNIIELFKPINPSYSRIFKNTTERAALERLVASIGEEKVISSIGVAAVANGMPYAPTITTPLELERNLGKLIAFYKKENNKINKITSKIAWMPTK